MMTLTARAVVTGAAMLQLIAEHAGLAPRDFNTGAWLDKLDPALDITARDILTGAYVEKLNINTEPTMSSLFDIGVAADYDFFAQNSDFPLVLNIGRQSTGTVALTINPPWPTGLNHDQQIEWIVTQLNQQAAQAALGFTFGYVQPYRQISLSITGLAAGDSLVITQDYSISPNLATKLLGQNTIYIEV